MSPTYRFELTKTAKKDIQKLNKQIATRIEKKLVFFIKSEKPLHFAEPLKEPVDAEYRWRVGNYRVLFDESNGLITVLRLQHRSEVYKK